MELRHWKTWHFLAAISTSAGVRHQYELAVRGHHATGTVMSVDTTSQHDWKLDTHEVRVTVDEALRQRRADRSNARYTPDETWVGIAREAYAWDARTNFAAILTGLIARATDARADARSLQTTNPNGLGYSAASVWKTFYLQATDLDLRRLKGVPFNNSPYSGKKVIALSWNNVKTTLRPQFERLNEILHHVNSLDSGGVKSALRAFLSQVPNAVGAGDLNAEIVEGGIDLRELFPSVERFLLDNSENGRRGQALVAACFALVHGKMHVETPESVNDPSRNTAGDVRVLDRESRKGHYSEAKQRLIQAKDLSSFAEEVRGVDEVGTASYAALVNDSDRVRAAGSRISLPGWKEILDNQGVLMAIWESPANILRDAIIWSGLQIDDAVPRFAEFYAYYLDYVEVEADTLETWREFAETFGVVLDSNESE